MMDAIKNIKVKLILIFILPAIGMLYFSSSLVSNNIKSYISSKDINSFVEHIKVNSSLIKELQKERGLNIAYLSKKSTYFFSKLKKQRVQTDKMFKNYNNSLKGVGKYLGKEYLKEFFLQFENLEKFRKLIEKNRVDIFGSF